MPERASIDTGHLKVTGLHRAEATKTSLFHPRAVGGLATHRRLSPSRVYGIVSMIGPSGGGDVGRGRRIGLFPDRLSRAT
jgi:hypothetical protein